MKLKIVDLPKFVRSVIIILGVVLLVSLFISKTTLSHADSKYKEIYTSNGDTLWNIAKEEKQSNSYYENKDIRSIIDNIKSINKLSNSDLKVNQKLIIPSI